MTVAQLLATLHENRIAIWTAGEKLLYRAPQGALTEALKSELVERKAEIILFLKAAAVTPEPIPAAPADGMLPLSFAEEGLWLLEQISPGSSAWNMQSGVRIRGVLDAASLERSLNELISRHETLRTSYRLIDGKVVRTVASELTIELQLSPLDSSNDNDAQVRRIAAEEEKRPFDLSTAPLFRTRLLRLSESEHLFLYTVHHIITDSWSNRVFYRDLLELYGAYAQGRPPALDVLPIRYSDYAAWIRHEGNKTLPSALPYWMKKLEGFAIQEIPADYRRPDQRAYRGATRSILLGRDVTRGIHEFCRQERATTFMLLVAAFKVLLRRYTASDDIVVGSALAGRTRPELENLVGMFINGLPLRSGLGGNPSFRELLRRVREVCLEAYHHQDMPYQKLIEAFNPGRGANRNPLFQVLFDIVDLPLARLDVSGHTVDFIDRPEDTARYEIVIRAPETAEGMEIRIDYAIELFSRTRIAEMLEQYKYLLQQAVEDPDRGIDEYSLLTDTARKVLPDPVAPLDSDWIGPAHTLFSQHAKRQPDAVAVADWREQWTYGELDRRSNQLAHSLRAKGVGRENVVAIYGDRSAALVWALMGVLKAGAAFFIVDPSHPLPRVKEYLEAVRPMALIALPHGDLKPEEVEAVFSGISEDCRIHLPPQAAAGTCGLFQEDWQKDLKSPVAADDLVCVIFTSGSTGKPKGVLGRHGPLTHFLPWVSQTFEISDRDRFSALAGVSSNILQREIFTALSLGATLYIPGPGDLGAAGKLDSWLADNAITVAHLTPAMAQVLDESTRQSIATVRRVFFAGDLLKMRDIERIRKWMPAAKIINFYASSESQRASGYKIVSQDTDGRAKDTPSLGRGVQGVQLLVLNGRHQVAGVGELGEIWVRSPHLARGYLGDPVLTAERFITNPFTGDPRDRIFCTGEQGRFLPDGEVEFAGRAENQTSIRGFRIELGEVESAVARHPAVREAVVAALEDAAGDKRLIAYVVPKREPAPTTSDLRAILGQMLPDYMVPSAFVFLNQLPLTPNGKVARDQLPQLDQRRPQLQYKYAAPRNPAERLLAEIWEEILNLERVGIHDNFFDLGGHSILAVRLAAEVERKFRKNIPVAMPFQAPTIAHMAKALSRLGDATPSSIIAVQTAGRRIPFFCVHGDDAHVSLARHLGPDQPFYGLTQKLDPRKIRRARVEELADHYIEELRRIQAGGPYYLGGHAFGAVIAFEMARQLRQSGAEVALLAFFDPVNPDGRMGESAVASRVLKNVWERPMEAVEAIARRTRRVLGMESTSGSRSYRLDEAVYDRAYRRILQKYSPKPYHGPAVFFKPEKSPDHRSDRWRALLKGPLESHSVPGDRRNLMGDASVPHLARQLRTYLNKAHNHAARSTS